MFQIVYAKESEQHNIDSEFVYPIGENVTEDISLPARGTLTIRDVPGIPEAATYIYEGDPDNIDEHLVDVQRWVAANGYKLGDKFRIVMLRGPVEQLPAKEWMQEIQYPLEKA
jgi:hypothetical protein